MRSEIGKLNFDKLFEERESLNERIVSAIEHESMSWGVHSIRYEIKDIEAPAAIQKAMVLQAEAERRKRASILASEGEMTANINLANAEKMAQILEAEGKAEGIIIKAKAQGDALKSIETAMRQEGGAQAAEFIIGQRFITAYRGLASKNNTLIMPSQPHKIAE